MVDFLISVLSFSGGHTVIVVGKVVSLVVECVVSV